MKLIKTYGFSLLLIISIGAGLLLGRTSPPAARAIRPLGDLFLNLIFMIIVPLVFFTVSSSIAGSASAKKLSRISWWMAVVFLATSLVAAIASLAFMMIVAPTPGAGIVLKAPPVQEFPSLLAQLVNAFTAPDFPEMISRKSMLPLIVFSVGVGLATLSCKEAGAPFASFLASGARVFIRLVDYVMLLAPLGLLAWFAATVVDTGEALASAYLKVFWVYIACSLIYYFAGFSIYALLAGGAPGFKKFWRHMLNPSLTALGTCSSMATMPVNLEAAPRMGAPFSSTSGRGRAVPPPDASPHPRGMSCTSCAGLIP